MQAAAIPYRLSAGLLEVLLVTSRTRRRWILPKGKVTKGMAPARSAAKEALEEAGVTGRVALTPVAEYAQVKQSPDGRLRPIRVSAFPLAVRREFEHWAEDGQRERRWMLLTEAIASVEDGEIKTVLARFATSRCP